MYAGMHQAFEELQSRRIAITSSQLFRSSFYDPLLVVEALKPSADFGRRMRPERPLEQTVVY